MSRQTEAKKARRQKRRAVRDARWIPEPVLDDVVDNLELADVLERFDELVAQRGWVFSEEFSDEESALWFWPPSLVEATGDEVTPVTTIVMFADDDAEIAHVMFVGTKDGYEFTIDELLDHLDLIEVYRVDDPLPEFDPS
ncbi:MAG TPA: hypothetical protein VEQ67_02100 [Mycobacterium sp.]|uniref:hypothetical protein n=1 Tax=Mycobacterium sp. TaxID=1785 RepID=UPI0028BA7BCE|nr:hypothetical protein [Mycobacterium sp.]HYR12997.1 hypothetical protein [Mycobacterium sp.]